MVNTLIFLDSRKNNRVIDYNDIYKREWLALFKRVLETAAEVC